LGVVIDCSSGAAGASVHGNSHRALFGVVSGSGSVSGSGLARESVTGRGSGDSAVGSFRAPLHMFPMSTPKSHKYPSEARNQ
jgi:hypothetical protein